MAWIKKYVDHNSKIEFENLLSNFIIDQEYSRIDFGALYRLHPDLLLYSSLSNIDNVDLGKVKSYEHITFKNTPAYLATGYLIVKFENKVSVFDSHRIYERDTFDLKIEGVFCKNVLLTKCIFWNL